MYPAALSWAERNASCGWLSGQSGATRLERLAEIVRNPVEFDMPENLRTVYALTAAGFLERDAASGELRSSPAVSAWIDEGDSGCLIAQLHARTRFIGELLDFVKEPHTIGEIRSYAASKFGLRWKTNDQLHRRLSWLRDAGAISLQFDNRYVATELGLRLLERLENADPTDGDSETVVGDLRPATGEIASLLSQLDAETLSSRRVSISYVPGGGGSIYSQLPEFLAELGQTFELGDFEGAAADRFNINPASARSALTFLSQSGMVERTGSTTYGLTDLARSWVADPDPIDLVRILHARFSFFGEVLVELADAETSDDLAVIAASSYGLQNVKRTDVRVRLQLLRTAGLVISRSPSHFAATPLGVELAATLPLQEPVVGTRNAVPIAPRGLTASRDLLGRLDRDCRDGSQPARFEQTVAEAFEFLGFRCQIISGPGNTDVLATAPQLAGGYRIAVDAKATGSGSVGDSMVNFDALRDHRKKHLAKYSTLVAVSFSPRVERFALENGVLPLQVQRLGELLEMQESAPIGAAEFESLLLDGDLDERFALVRDMHSARERQLHLVRRLMTLLAEEAEGGDPITNGALSVEGLYLVLRSDDDPPSADEISMILGWLTSPLIAAVERHGAAYRAVEDPLVVARRLGRLGDALAPRGQLHSVPPSTRSSSVHRRV